MSDILKPKTEVHSSAIAFFAGRELEVGALDSPDVGKTFYSLVLETFFKSEAERDKAYAMIMQHERTK